MKDTIELNIIKEDFDGAVYTMPCNCAISRAFIRQEEITSRDALVLEGVNSLDFHEKPGSYRRYEHELYELDQFKEDLFKAEEAKPGEVIRTIILQA